MSSKYGHMAFTKIHLDSHLSLLLLNSSKQTNNDILPKPKENCNKQLLIRTLQYFIWLWYFEMQFMDFMPFTPAWLSMRRIIIQLHILCYQCQRCYYRACHQARLASKYDRSVHQPLPYFLFHSILRVSIIWL